MRAALLLDPLGATSSLVSSMLPVFYIAALLALAIVASLVLRRVSTVAAFRQVHPWIPLLHLAVWLPMVWLLESRLVPAFDGPRALARGLVAVTLIVAGLPWLRSVFLGVVFALELRYRLGDDLRVGAVEGRIVGVGLRALTLRGADGTDAVIPYERLASETVVRLNLADRDTPCDLVVDVPPGVSPTRAAELARQAAALSRFSSPRCQPEVFLLPRDGSALHLALRVRGYLFDREHEERYRSDLVERLHAAFAAELGHAGQQPGF